MDVSADLTELGKCPITVVCAGVKSILDIGRTLEMLVSFPMQLHFCINFRCFFVFVFHEIFLLLNDQVNIVLSLMSCFWIEFYCLGNPRCLRMYLWGKFRISSILQ